MFKFLELIDRGIERVAGWILVVSVVLMLFISVSIIVLRWIDISFLWFEPFIRHLVFLSAFMGGVLATGRRTHIGIDIIGKYFESKEMWKAFRWVGRVVSLVSLLTLIWLTKSTLDFVILEAKYGKEVFLGIHSKFLVGLIPFGTSLIACRFFYLFVSSFSPNFEDIIEERK